MLLFNPEFTWFIGVSPLYSSPDERRLGERTVKCGSAQAGDVPGVAREGRSVVVRRFIELLREHNALVREKLKAHGAFAERNASLPAHPEPVEGRAEPTPPAHGSRASPRAGREVRATTDGGIEAIRVRIGLHTGEPIKEGDDFFGKHVNLAARVASQAAGGEILASSLLKELADSAGDISFGEGREVELKGLAGSHRVFAVAWR